MLEFDWKENTWTPPHLSDEELRKIIDMREKAEEGQRSFLVIFRTEPYIDSVYLYFDQTPADPVTVRRFAFAEDFVWSRRYELMFESRCLHNDDCVYTYRALDEIYRYYSEKHPEWHLKRYYSKGLRLLDHIYHCMRRNTVKEMLYKAGLDELADRVNRLDELNLLAAKPSELYGGLSMRTIRCLNCEAGARMLNEKRYRRYIRKLQQSYPDIFSEPLNDAQCLYLQKLIDAQCTVGETGRLYLARRKDLSKMWIKAQYDLMLLKDSHKEKRGSIIQELGKIDPLYEKILGDRRKEEDMHRTVEMQEEATLRYYLLLNREACDIAIRRSIRKRPADWQERDHGYVVRYPQTINDFCREAVYMGNCLIAYYDAFVHNDTTILFMRDLSDVNKPFITIEIFEGELKQAYRRFNRDCTPEEAEWIREYCKRHGIGLGVFSFGVGRDLLF